MGKVLPYHLFLCTIFFLFKGCLGTQCKSYYSYWSSSYTYITCLYGCCGTTYDQYCCGSSWTSWSSWNSWNSWSSWSDLSDLTTTTGGVSVGVIVGCSIAGIVIFVSIVGGIIAAVYKATRGNRMVRPGGINNANIIARTNASGQHPIPLSMNPSVSNSTYPPNPAGSSQIPSNYMHQPTPATVYPAAVPPPAPAYPNSVPPPYEPEAPKQ